MGDEGEKITVKLGKKKPARIADDAEEIQAPPLPGTTFSLEDAKAANLANLNNKSPEIDHKPSKPHDSEATETHQDDNEESKDSHAIEEKSYLETEVEDDVKDMWDDNEQPDESDKDNNTDAEATTEEADLPIDQDTQQEAVKTTDNVNQDKNEAEAPAPEFKPDDKKATLSDQQTPITTAKDAPVIRGAKQKKSHKKLIIGVVSVILLVFIIGGVGVYRHIVQPKQALTNYLTKFTNESKRPKALSYDIATQIKDKYGRYNFNLTGDWDASSKVKSLLSLDINGKYYSSGEQTEDINVETVTEIRDGKSKTYANVHKPVFIDTIFPGSLNNWLELDSGSVSKFGVKTCQQGSPFVNQAATDKLAKLAVSDVQRVGFLPQAVNGYRADQFRGKIKGDDLLRTIKEILTDYNNRCKTQIAISSADEQNMRGIAINYDVWLGQAFDKLSVVVNQPNQQELSFSITTKNYNTKHNISVPKDSKTLESIISDLDEDTFDYYLDDTVAENVQESTTEN